MNFFFCDANKYRAVDLRVKLGHLSLKPRPLARAFPICKPVKSELLAEGSIQKYEGTVRAKVI